MSTLINQKRAVKVVVLDTGTDYIHPDLENSVVVESGYNFVDNNYETMDDNGHGTHVSGKIVCIFYIIWIINTENTKYIFYNLEENKHKLLFIGR